jgi:citrate lyase beta subunit
MNKLIAWFALGAVAFLTAACETPRRRPPPMRVHSSSQPLGVADVKMLAKSGISDEVILSQIRNTHTVYHLSAAEILDLKDNNVSEKVIDFMINTAAMYRPAYPPPPPPSY